MDDKRKRPAKMNYPGNPSKPPKRVRKTNKQQGYGTGELTREKAEKAAAPTAFRPSPVKNMAYWSAKNGPASALKAGALAAVQGVEKGVKAVKGIKDTVDSLTGKTAMTDAMNAPISQTASGKEAK